MWRSNTTLAGCEARAANDLTAFLAVSRIEYRVTDSAVAPHSPVIDEWKPDLLEPLGERISDPLPIPYYSAAAPGRDQVTSYPIRLWRSMREPIFIGRMLDSLIADGYTLFLEMSGRPFLADWIHRRAAGRQVITLPTAKAPPFHAVATVNSKTTFRMPMPGPRPFRSIMDITQEALRRAGVVIRPPRITDNTAGEIAS
jgi:acyl transferase domain-containing protein